MDQKYGRRVLLEQRILRLLLDGPCSRQELIDNLRIRPNTVSSIVALLIEEGKVRPSHRVTTTGGRPRAYFELDNDYRYFGGVLLTGESIVGVVLGFAGRVVHRTRITNSFDVSAAEFRENLDAVLCELGGHVPPGRLRDVTLGGNYFYDEGRMFSTGYVRDSAEIDLGQVLDAHAGTGFTFRTAADAHSMAERWFGAAKESSNFVTVHLGTGISCGIVHVDDSGRIRCTTGELGHTRPFSDQLCRCGRIGCLETRASVWAIREFIASNPGAFDVPPGRDLHLQPYSVMMDAYLDQARTRPSGPVGDHLRQMTVNIGTALRNIVDLIGPDLIVLHGRLLEVEDIVVSGIAAQVRVPASPETSGPFVRMWEERKVPRIAVSSLGAYGGAMGAAGFGLAECYHLPAPSAG